ncbi:MAG: NAD(P)H-dependent oxidoreductase [Burkholderiaceae bacterium]
MSPSPSLPPKPAAGAPEVLVLVAHPQLELSRANRRLMDAACAIGPRVAVRDLYALYPDFLIDVAAEQAALGPATLVVWLHPVHWYGMPPLMKLWLDDVLAFGWAYGPDGEALRGKDLWLVASTGGAEDSYRPDSYNRYFFDAFLPPYEQTAALCGLRFLPPLLLHGAHRAGPDEIAAHADTFAQRLASYPQWDELALLDECPACEVPSTARPAAESAHATAGAEASLAIR